MAAKKDIILFSALMLGILLLVALIFRARRNIRQIDEVLQNQSESIRLANRTVELRVSSFPKEFVQYQTPSSRGTVPYLVICAGTATRAVRVRVEACGARAMGIVSARALLVEADRDALAKIASDATFSAACELTVADKVSAKLSSTTDSEVDVTIVPTAAEDVQAISNAVVSCGGSVLATPVERVRARIPAAQAEVLARRGDVRWIERYVPAKLLNDVAVNPGIMNVRKVWASSHGLTGAGQIITYADSGLDTGDPDTVLEDFKGRVNIVRTADDCYGYDIVGHGTHVAGSLIGDGTLSDGEIKGVAYGATLNVWQGLKEDGYLYVEENLDELFRPSQENFPSYIFSGSWGYADGGLYTCYCEQYDSWIWQHPDGLVVLAAGNESNEKVMDPGCAKNTLCVGATENLRTEVASPSNANNPSEIAYCSSPGLTADGRIKPDVCAPGTYILSTLSTKCGTTDLGWGAYAANAHYAYLGGTSMATPLVAGCAALVRQWLVERRGFSTAPPTAALMKAVLTGGAHDMFADADTNLGSAAPNRWQGWGRVDLGETLYPSNRTVKLVDRIPFADGSEGVWRVETVRTAPLDVQLSWIDYPSTAVAGGGLVNDLDLVVSNRTTGAVWWGNGVAGGDRTNNVEGVRIKSAPAGTYSVHVRGAAVPYDFTEGGAAALYMRGAFKEGTSVLFR